MTPEEKKDLFNLDPDMFIHREDIIAGFVRTEKSYAIAIYPKTREEMTRAIGELSVALTKEIIKFDGIQAMKKSSIAKPQGILNFARRR